MLLFILILLLLLIIYTLLVPIILFIDTSTNQYFIKIKGLAKASIESDKLEVFKVHLKVLGFNFFFYPLKKKSLKKDSEIEKKTKTKRHFKSIPFRKLLRVIKSFKIKQFQLNIDTGDCVSNSKLYPVFAFLNYYKGSNLAVNFEGRNNLLLSIENRPIHIIKSFINN